MMTLVPIGITSHLNTDQVRDVIALADRHRRWLGFLPASALEEMAGAGQVLAATDGDRVLGYVLFDLTRNDVRIVQLCVDDAARGLGVARLLIEHVSRRFRDYRGLRLTCRRDWPAHQAWPRLGFGPMNTKPGRGKKPSELVVWWKEHPHATLFSPANEQVLTVAIDTDVFSTIFAGDPFTDTEALVLAPGSPLMSDDVQLVATPELAREVEATEDPSLRRRYLNCLAGLHPLPADPALVRSAVDDLLDLVPEAVLAADPSLAADARMVAAAHVAGASVFATADRNARAHLGPLASDLWGFEVLRPIDVHLWARTKRQKVRYSPVALANTGFSVADVTSGDRDDLAMFLDNAGAERRSAWDRRLTLAQADVLHHGGLHRLVRDATGTPLGLLIASLHQDSLAASIFRVNPEHHLSGSVARQLAALLRDHALAAGLGNVRVDDVPHMGPTSEGALRDEGFKRGGKGYYCQVWDEIVDSNDVRLATLSMDLAPTVHAWAEVEHQAWPLKIRGAGLPCVIIPIRPGYADDLLGLQTLVERRVALGLSREQVYYRAPKGGVPVPGRVLWYVSSPISAVVAASSIIAVDVGAPDELHRENARFGVWRRKDVRAAARNDRVQAIRFQDTRLLAPVNYERLVSLASSDRLGTLQTVTKISEPGYLAIYEAGRRP